MDAIEAIKTRRTVRKFTDTPVSREIITEIINAAAYAPSWKNSRTPRWYVVTDRALIHKLAQEATFGFEHNKGIIEGCSCLIVQSAVKCRAGYERDGSFTTDKGDSWEMYDGGIAAQTLCLAAHAAGLGTVIMGIVDDKKMEELLLVPETERVLAAIAIGYPAETPAAPPKYKAEDITKFF